MPVNSPRTIQGKFTLYLSAFIVVIMTGLSLVAISREKRLMENVIVQEGKALVGCFAIACTNTMLYEEVGLVDEGGLLDNYIADLMGKKGIPIRYAMILDQRGRAIAHSSVRETGTVYRDSVARRALSSWSTLLQYPSPVLLDISTPLAISSKRWGTLRIGVSLQNMRDEISALAWRYALYTVGAIAMAIAVNGVLFGLITKPLKSLSQEMDAMKFRDDVPVPALVRRDEIGSLYRSF